MVLMAELTVMESKIGEVAGLAMAAKSATSKVIQLAKGSDEQLVGLLTQMNEEAAETEERCASLAGSFDGKKTAILEEAKATKDKGAKMLEIYLDADSDVLDGFEFLTMAEAGEVGHWEVLEQIANTAQATEVLELTKWAIPIQRRHFSVAKSTSAKLAADEDPDETS
jgi:hypothetical protein